MTAPSKSRKTSAAAASYVAKDRKTSAVAAAFEWSVPGMGGLSRPVWMAPKGGLSMIDTLKGRNNYYKMDVRDQASICRRMAERNWFLRGVLPMRRASITEDFRAMDDKGQDLSGQYDLRSLVKDVVDERLVTTNVVCLWRKGTELPTVTVLDAETVDYSAAGGLERITIQYSKDEVMAKDKENKDQYIKILGQRAYDAYTTGGKLTIIKGEDENEWDFEVMISGKRRGVFCIPEPIPYLDTIDYLELMGIGDWNLAWFRKDVMRIIRKGYKGTQGGGVNAVDISKDDIKKIGDGFSNLSGNVNVPANHDVDPFYFTVDPANFKPEMVESAIDRLMIYGGIEATILMGSFSQQNGAAPTLMRNARTYAFAVREEIESLLTRILAAPEFSSISGGKGKQGFPTVSFQWGVKSLYSIEEMTTLSRNLHNGTASTRTIREMFGLSDTVEGERIMEEHKNRKANTPSFESGQGLLPMLFPEDFHAANSVTPTLSAPGTPGAPKKVK